MRRGEVMEPPTQYYDYHERTTGRMYCSECQICQHYEYIFQKGHLCDGKPLTHNIYNRPCPFPKRRRLIPAEVDRQSTLSGCEEEAA